MAKRQRKRNGARYFIETFEPMTIIPTTKHALYLDKCIGLW